MKKSLLFLPDISGFTNFIQTTEAEHSQHVISELLEVLIGANTEDLQLAEIEGDALFFYKENEIPSMEKLLAQIETMFTAFYSHLKLLEKNRICPCNACATAPNLQLKIIAHSGEIQFISVQDKRKPFGAQVIEAHRLMKNSVDSDNYVLLSKNLVEEIGLPENYQSKLYRFETGQNEYDGRKIDYFYSVIDNDSLKLKPFSQAKKVNFTSAPGIHLEKNYPISASQLMEYITNFKYRHEWVEGVDKFEFKENEVNRLGTQHVCVINEKHFDFVTITKEGKPGQLIVGELTHSSPPVDSLYQFFIVTPLAHDTCKLELEIFWKERSIFKRIMMALVIKRILKKTFKKALETLHAFVVKPSTINS